MTAHINAYFGAVEDAKAKVESALSELSKSIIDLKQKHAEDAASAEQPVPEPVTVEPATKPVTKPVATKTAKKK